MGGVGVFLGGRGVLKSVWTSVGEKETTGQECASNWKPKSKSYPYLDFIPVSYDEGTSSTQQGQGVSSAWPDMRGGPFSWFFQKRTFAWLGGRGVSELNMGVSQDRIARRPGLRASAGRIIWSYGLRRGACRWLLEKIW